MTVTVRVLAQYWENYSDTDTPYWKPKMGHEFIFENVDSDTVMYAQDLEGALTELVAAESNSHEKFEYREHEVIFHEPTKIKADKLEQAIIKQFDK